MKAQQGRNRTGICMKSILFITGNDRKVWQAQESLKDYGIKVTPKDIGLDEIQSHDPLAIARHKAHEAQKLAKKPIVVNAYRVHAPRCQYARLWFYLTNRT